VRLFHRHTSILLALVSDAWCSGSYCYWVAFIKARLGSIEIVVTFIWYHSLKSVFDRSRLVCPETG
jgi:hypothetical protein